jgi:thiol-disulfide isomerase/thioredoxin
MIKRPTVLMMLFGILLFTSSCVVVENPYDSLAPGKWRGYLIIDDFSGEAQPIQTLEEIRAIRYEEVKEEQLPFLFEVIYDDETHFHIEITNGEERIEVRDITIGRDRATAKDTIRIDFPLYESHISAIFQGDVMQGTWVVETKSNYEIPFVAKQGENYRFAENPPAPAIDLNGKWETTFGLETDDPFKGIGEFTQEGNQLSGTFMTETGDYRYLAGQVVKDKFYLSTFDGAHAFLFEGKQIEDGSLIGSFRSGNHYKVTWEAKKNPDFKLSDADSLTYLTSETFDFQFKDTKGQMVSLSDTGFENKVTIIQILGTWCPNCRDETEFLIEYLNAHPNEDLQVIGIAFERHQEEEKAMEQLRRYKERMKIPYPILYGGYYDKKAAAETLGSLNAVIAYPTLLFLDRQHEVQKIHTGFSGPATSAYADFAQEFESFVTTLLEEGD